MSNKRVSELAQISISDMDDADLLLISDVNHQESKKLTLGDLGKFLLNNGFLTASIYGTSSYALQAATASYVGPHSASYSPTSSWAFNAITASYTSTTATASFSLTSSYIATASYALASLAQSVLSASFAGNAISASFLAFDPLVSNGTASYAMKALSLVSSQVSASYASTASYASYSAVTAQALQSNTADTASFVQTASYLAFNGVPNGTASYAIYAASIPNVRQDFGTFFANTQSILSSQLDLVSVTPTFGGQQATNFEAYGTVDVPFTSSNPASGRIEMFVLDRATGYSQSLDFSPVYINIGSSTTAVSGTMRFPFTLRGEAPLYGLYKVYVTASYNEVFFDTSRTMKYKITSTSDQLSVQAAEPTLFSSYPSNVIMLYSSSLHPGVAYQGSASQVIYSGSQDATALTIPAGTINNLYYTWTLNGLVTMSVDNNPGLTDLGGIPTSCVSMSAANCGLTYLPDMSVGSLKYLNVPGNNIVANLTFPISMSYINIAGNYYANLPTQIPAGLTVLIADGIGSSNTPYIMPDTLISTSFNSCPNLTSWIPFALPANIKYINTSGSPLGTFPSVMPSNLLYIDVSYCSLSASYISNIANGLVSNGLSNGIFSFINNPASESAFNITTNVNTLISRGWTVIS